tara:strand:+ start:364 stop:546 length:183 start_codon:yes stop_codon:yes gene_type:complete
MEINQEIENIIESIKRGNGNKEIPKIDVLKKILKHEINNRFTPDESYNSIKKYLKDLSDV